jgi:large repetitive protein
MDEDTTLNALVVEDILPDGMQFFSHESITADTSIYSTVWWVTSIVPTYSSGTNVLTYSFGNLTNSDTSGLTDEEVIIRYTAIVVDDGKLQQGDVLVNEATLSWSDGELSDAAEWVEILEPSLVLDKSVPAMNVSWARTITYVITLEHDEFSTSDAFEATFMDDLASRDMEYVPGTINYIQWGTWLILDNGSPFVVQYWHIPLLETVQFSFDARLFDSVETSATVTNIWSLQRSSVPEETDYERDGIGSWDTVYSDEDDAVVEFVTTSEWYKQIVSTSHADTIWYDVAIGETVVYEIALVVPYDGTLNNLIVTDILPEGMEYVWLVGSKISWWAWIYSTLSWWFASIVPQYMVADDTIIFDLGDVINTNSVAWERLVTIEYELQVMNEIVNQQWNMLVNTATIEWSDSEIELSAPAVTIGEPDIATELSLEDLYPDSDGVLSFWFEIRHTPWSDADGYDVTVTLPLNGSDATYISGSLVGDW